MAKMPIYSCYLCGHEFEGAAHTRYCQECQGESELLDAARKIAETDEAFSQLIATLQPNERTAILEAEAAKLACEAAVTAGTKKEARRRLRKARAACRCSLMAPEVLDAIEKHIHRSYYLKHRSKMTAMEINGYNAKQREAYARTVAARSPDEHKAANASQRARRAAEKAKDPIAYAQKAYDPEKARREREVYYADPVNVERRRGYAKKYYYANRERILEAGRNRRAEQKEND